MRNFPLNIKIGALDEFTGTFANLSRNLNKIGRQASDMGRKMTVGLTAPIVGLGAFSIKSAADIEQMTVALEGMAGGAEGAARLMDQLMQFSASTPFQLEGISNAARMLLATEKIGVEDIQNALTVAGDIAAGSKSQISDIAYVMSKAASKGRADMEILNMFLERGIPIMGALQRETGKNQESLEKMISAGKISYDTLYRAMRSLREEGGVFENMMQKQSVTITGLLSTLSDNFKLAKASIGQSIVQTTKFQERITSLTTVLQDFTKWFNGLPPAIQEIAVWGAIVVAVLGPVLFTIGQIAIGLGVIIALLPKIAAGFGMITAAAPWLLLIAAIAAVGVLFYKLVDATGGIKNALMMVGAVILDVLVSPLRVLANIITKIWSMFSTPPAFLQKIAGGLFSVEVARKIAGEQSQARADENRAAFAMSQQAEAQTARSQTDINVKFDNVPRGTRADVKTDSNANVAVEQGLAMEGVY